MSLSKNRKLVLEKYDRDKDYSLDDAIGLIKDMKFSKFDESVDIALNMGVDPVSYTHLTLPTILLV